MVIFEPRHTTVTPATFSLIQVTDLIIGYRRPHLYLLCFGFGRPGIALNVETKLFKDD